MMRSSRSRTGSRPGGRSGQRRAPHAAAAIDEVARGAAHERRGHAVDHLEVEPLDDAREDRRPARRSARRAVPEVALPPPVDGVEAGPEPEPQEPAHELVVLAPLHEGHEHAEEAILLVEVAALLARSRPPRRAGRSARARGAALPVETPALPGRERTERSRAACSASQRAHDAPPSGGRQALLWAVVGASCARWTRDEGGRRELRGARPRSAGTGVGGIGVRDARTFNVRQRSR